MQKNSLLCMVTMTRSNIRYFVRARVLDVLGACSSISPGVHILNGHLLNADNVGTFKKLLKGLKNKADLVNFDTASELITNSTSKELSKEKCVAFSFDDGYEDCYSRIEPILNEFSVRGAYFINPALLGVDREALQAIDFFNNQAPLVERRGFMSQAMVKDLSNNGCVIGAHTIDHLRLVNLPCETSVKQIMGCKELLENITGKSCEYFAWTYGKYTDIDRFSLDIALSNFKFVYSSDRYGEYFGRFSLGNVINRRHFECDWPLNHVNYMLSKVRR